MKFIDMTGQKFGRLTVIECSGRDKHGQAMWRCSCECGRSSIVSGGSLRKGHTKSCGCLEKETKAEMHKTHEKRHTRLYRVWSNIKDRCLNESGKAFKWYGAKGVTICTEWLDFQTFYEWAVANGYDESAERGECTIDRIDPAGNYCPDNCRWVPMSVQLRNTRKTRHLTYCDETHTIGEWADIFGIGYFKFYNLLKKHNFDIERAMQSEKNRHKSYDSAESLQA